MRPPARPGGGEASSPADRFQGQGTAGEGDACMSNHQTAIHPYVTGFLNLSADRFTDSLWRLNFPTLGSSV